jgi:DNA-binding MarR family transcriptional regulator
VEISAKEYRALAEVRYSIRRFLRCADIAARSAGLSPQQYQVLLAIQGLPRGEEATIRTLAERIALQHHNVGELVDRLEKHGYLCGSRGSADRRLVMVSLLPKGERLLEELVRRRFGELRVSGAGHVA